MAWSAILFVAGVWLAGRQPALALPLWFWPALPLALAAAWRRPRHRFLLALPAGFCWALAHAWLIHPAVLPDHWLQRSVGVEGRVAGLPRCDQQRCSFDFQADRLVDGRVRRSGRWRFRLAWYRHPPPLRSGERWRMRVKLKPVVGYRNPGGFDYAGWLQARGVRYRGYVVAGEYLEAAEPGIDRLRQEISASLDRTMDSPAAAAVMRALVVGDRSGLGHRLRDLFSATGTSHLMAISGLHIGLVAGLVWLLSASLWWRFPSLCARWPARLAAAPAALAAAFGYAALAGFSLPTQRALVMLAVLVAALLARRHLPPARALAMAAVAVLLWQPSAVEEAGFWLSFGAVAILLVWAPRLRGRIRWLWLQLGVSLGLLPILVWQGMALSLVSPLVNLAAIPLFSLLVVPGALVATLLEMAFGWPGGPWLTAMGWLVDRLLAGLEWAARWNPQVAGTEPWLWAAFAAAAAGLAWPFAGRGWKGRFAAVAVPLGVALLMFLRIPRPPPANSFELTLLDVGQGLSAVVRTHRHLLVYDTGPAFPSGFDTGAAVVAPYLAWLGAGRVDRLVLSHGDNDHVGGAAGLLARARVDGILAGEPQRVRLRQRVVPCRAGDQWWWDGVHFQILWPPPESRLRGNDASCVLRVSTGREAALLTGDLEADGEARLLRRAGHRLASGVVVAGHHGSSTSSSPAFVAATRPQWVLFSAGPFNRWGFPKPEVVERWRRVAGHLLDTSAVGAIRLRLSRRRIRLVEAYAKAHRRHWQWRQERGACSMIARIDEEEQSPCSN